MTIRYLRTLAQLPPTAVPGWYPGKPLSAPGSVPTPTQSENDVFAGMQETNDLPPEPWQHLYDKSVIDVANSPDPTPPPSSPPTTFAPIGFKSPLV